MILAHVLVAIDYYAKCPNLKKPDSLSSTYICSNATHYFKILKKETLWLKVPSPVSIQLCWL